MVYSQSLLARRGPLGAIWVAAYCFKKLKKTQITETDILAAIDKILKDEWDGVAYRVLAYLLLGVVRIYSRKVEYLFDDCNEVLLDIKKFVFSTKDNAPAEMLCAAYHSVIIPDRFELDAFDMGSLEDVSGEHLASHKEITLKECAEWNGIGRLSSEMYDHVEFGACHSIFSTYYTPVGSVLSSHLMDFGMELITSSSGAKSEEIIEQLQWHRFSQEECADIDTFIGIEKEPQNQVKQYGEDNETNGEQIKTPDIAVPEDGIQEEGQKTQNHEIFYGNNREPSCHVITGEDHHSEREEMMEIDLVQPENQSFQITKEEHGLRNVEADMENRKNATFSQEESLDLDVLSGAKKPQELVCSYGEENHNDEEPTKLQDIIAPDTMKIIPEEDPDPLSVAYDGSPDTKQPDALGITTPKLTAVPRPASKKSARFSRKRKCVFDDMVVLPNEVIRQSIHDASDLVAKRKKVPKNAHAVWKTCRIGNLAQNFLEPLISNVSQELRSLLCKRKLRKLKITPEKLDLLDCQRTGISEQMEVVHTETVEPAEDLDVLENPCTVGLEQVEIAPDTPVLRSKSIKSFHSPRSPEVPDMDLVRPETSGRIEKEPSMGAEQTFPSGSVEEVPPSLDRDEEHDFNFLSEEAEFCEGVNPELDGCSVRTRKVARYLHRHFTICNSLHVNLLEVAERRTKKESARLFYETLVMKTRGFVDVKQADPYGDILIWKLPKWDQMWGDDTSHRVTSETMSLCR
ncbi:sister chromatid cohesion 1 protein 2 [Rosa sericea]